MDMQVRIVHMLSGQVFVLCAYLVLIKYEHNRNTRCLHITLMHVKCTHTINNDLLCTSVLSIG